MAFKKKTNGMTDVYKDINIKKNPELHLDDAYKAMYPKGFDSNIIDKAEKLNLSSTGESKEYLDAKEKVEEGILDLPKLNGIKEDNSRFINNDPSGIEILDTDKAGNIMYGANRVNGLDKAIENEYKNNMLSKDMDNNMIDVNAAQLKLELPTLEHSPPISPETDSDKIKENVESHGNGTSDKGEHKEQESPVGMIKYKLDEAMQKTLLDKAVSDVKINQLGKIPYDDLRWVLYNGYNKNRIINPGNYNGFRKVHYFMTIPSCNIFGNVEKGTSEVNERGAKPSLLIKESMPELYDFIMTEDNLELAKYLDRDGHIFDLTQDSSKPKPVFMFPLMNLIKNVGPLPSFDMKLRESPKNVRGNYANLAVDSTTSLSAQTINITFEDDRWSTVSRLLYMWMRYMDGIGLGIIPPKLSATKYGYIDYDVSLYAFVTDETGINITHWFKWTSLFPKERNYSYMNLTNIIKERGEITVPFTAVAPTDFNVYDIAEFNYLSLVMRNMSSNISKLPIQIPDMQLTLQGMGLEYANKINVGGKVLSTLHSMDDLYPDVFYIKVSDYADSKTKGVLANGDDNMYRAENKRHQLLMFNSQKTRIGMDAIITERKNTMNTMATKIHEPFLYKF